MQLPFHFLLPVACCLTDGLIAGRRLFPWWALLLVGFVGILPDVLCPHTLLSERLQLWSHTMWACYGFVLLVVISAPVLRMPLQLVIAMCGAYVLHLAADAVSGGIAPLWPFDEAFVMGGEYIDPDIWPWFDVSAAMAVVALLLVRTRADNS